MIPRTLGEQSQPLFSGFRDGLECIAQGRSVLVPAGAVSHIIECDVVSLPLSRAHVSGVGVHSHELIVVLRLFDKHASESQGRRTVTAALLHTPSGSARFAIEVTRVVSLVSAQPLESAGPWVLKVTTADGRTLPWLLVDRVLAELGVVAAE